MVQLGGEQEERMYVNVILHAKALSGKDGVIPLGTAFAQGRRE